MRARNRRSAAVGAPARCWRIGPRLTVAVGACGLTAGLAAAPAHAERPLAFRFERVASIVRDLDIDGETMGFIAMFEDGVEAVYTATIDCCGGDFDGDGAVGAADLMLLLEAYGAPEPPSGGFGARDVDLDGAIGPDELLALLAGWGDCRR